MKSAKNWLSSGAAALGLAVLLAGCAGTVIPQAVRNTQPSWDANQQNSGFLGWDAAGDGVITTHARDRYNALVKLYAGHFHPLLDLDAGIKPAPVGTELVEKGQPKAAAPANSFLIDAEHLQYFSRMQGWFRAGKP